MDKTSESMFLLSRENFKKNTKFKKKFLAC